MTPGISDRDPGGDPGGILDSGDPIGCFLLPCW